MYSIRLPKKITLVVSNSRRHTIKLEDKTLQEAYVVFDKDSTESAKNWAHPSWANDAEPTIYEFEDNPTFTLKLLRSASGSSQGGKLSFWRCELIKDDIDVVVGINQDILLELLQQTNFNHGVCQSPVVFIREDAQTGVVAIDSEAYKSAVEAMQYKESVTKQKKTTKWERGHKYTTLTLEDVYVGDIYEHVSVDSRRCGQYTFTINPRKTVHVIATEDNLKGHFDNKEYYYAYSLDKFPSRSDAGDVGYSEAQLDSFITDFFATQVGKSYFNSTLFVSVNDTMTEEAVNTIQNLAKSEDKNRQRWYTDVYYVKHNEEEKEFHYATDAINYIINILKEEGVIKE